jgi:hypothetical protein
MKNILLFAVLLFSPFITFAAGTQTYSTPGTHTFTVPAYTGTLTVEVWGGGQYPVAYAPFMGETHGTAGGDSGFNVTVSSSCGGEGFFRGQTCTSSLSGGVTATGGHMSAGDPVTPGMGFGGDINMAGNPPIQAEPGYVGIGGRAPFGGIGGFSPDPTSNPNAAGQQPGGGGGNIGCAKFICWDRGGASGGYAKKTYTAGALTAGTAVTVVVGAGGNEEPTSKGGDGMVRIMWTDAAAAPVTSAAPACGAVTSPTTKTTGTSGSQTFSSVGEHYFTVPQYNGTLTVEVWGAGQYPVAFAPFMGETHGAWGGTSIFNNTVYAEGGHTTPSDPVTPGNAWGGDTNIRGNPPIQAEPGYVGIGGNAPFGGIGGYYPDPTTNPSGFGKQPGGGGGNIGCAKFICWDRGGASGGYAKKTYAAGALAVGASIPLYVAAGGSEGGSRLGGDGMVKVTWTATGQTLSLCTVGYTLQGGQCVAQGCPVCPAGQTRNEAGVCVPNTTCPAGYHFDLLTSQCVINGPTVCIPGYHLDTATNQCVPDGVILEAASTAWGFSSLIHWDAANANSCTGTGFNTNGATSGTVTTDPLLQTTTFTLVCDNGTKSVTVVIDSCPVGYVGTPPVCTLASNTCPAGYTGNPPNCSVASSCPLNYTGTPPNCTPIACVPTNICNGNNVVNSCTGALIQSCAYSCASGACIVPPPSVVSWTVAPLIVNQGTPTNVSWEVANVSSCSVSGTNGDSWTGLTGTKVSGAINAQTVFTLTCTALSGSGAPNVTRTATVNIVPVFQEK